MLHFVFVFVHINIILNFAVTLKGILLFWYKILFLGICFYKFSHFLPVCSLNITLLLLHLCTHLSKHFTLAYTTLLKCMSVCLPVFFSAVFHSRLIFDHIRTYLHLLTLSRKCSNKHYFTHSFRMHFFFFVVVVFSLLFSFFCLLIFFRTIVTSSKLLSIVFFCRKKEMQRKRVIFLLVKESEKMAQNKKKKQSHTRVRSLKVSNERCVFVTLFFFLSYFSGSQA